MVLFAGVCHESPLRRPVAPASSGCRALRRPGSGHRHHRPARQQRLGRGRRHRHHGDPPRRGHLAGGCDQRLQPRRVRPGRHRRHQRLGLRRRRDLQPGPRRQRDRHLAHRPVQRHDRDRHLDQLHDHRQSRLGFRRPGPLAVDLHRAGQLLPGRLFRAQRGTARPPGQPDHHQRFLADDQRQQHDALRQRRHGHGPGLHLRRQSHQRHARPGGRLLPGRHHQAVRRQLALYRRLRTGPPASPPT